jgi:hypothetical protein
MWHARLGLAAIVVASLGFRTARAADEGEVQSLLIPVNVLNDRQPESFTVAVGDVIEFYAFGGASPVGDALEFRTNGQMNPRRFQVVIPPGPAAAGAMGQFGGGGGPMGPAGNMGGMGGGMGGMMAAGMPGPSPSRSLNCTVRIARKGGPLERLAVLRRGLVDFYGEAATANDGPNVVMQGNGRPAVSVPAGPLTLVKASSPGKATVEVSSEHGKSRKETRTFEITVETREAREKRWANDQADAVKDDEEAPAEQPKAKRQRRVPARQGGAAQS